MNQKFPTILILLLLLIEEWDLSHTKGLSETTALRFTDAAKEQNILSEDGMAMLGFGVRTIAAALKFAETFQQ